MTTPRVSRKEVIVNGEAIVARESHAYLINHVSQWIKAVSEDNFPSKLSLNAWREKLIQNLSVVFFRILKAEAAKENKEKDASASIPNSPPSSTSLAEEAAGNNNYTLTKSALKSDYQVAFELIILLNLISLCQESTSYFTVSRDVKLNPDQIKSNSNLVARLDLIDKYLKKFEPNDNPQHLFLSDELLIAVPGRNIPYDREPILEVYQILKRKVSGVKAPKKQKDEQVPSHATLKMINKLKLVSEVWPPEVEKSSIKSNFDDMDSINSKSLKGSSSDEKLIDIIATQNGRTMLNQRYVVSEEKQKSIALNHVFDAVDKLGSRFDNQTAMTREQKQAENLAKVEEAIDRANRQTMDNQRYVLSKEKIEQLSLNELVNVVERLATQRMSNQDAISPMEKKKEMLNVVADVVEKMRQSSMDDQRFIASVAHKLNMTPKELNSSIESLPLSENSNSSH